jgi:hypothetical protein
MEAEDQHQKTRPWIAHLDAPTEANRGDATNATSFFFLSQSSFDGDGCQDQTGAPLPTGRGFGFGFARSELLKESRERGEFAKAKRG